MSMYIVYLTIYANQSHDAEGRIKRYVERCNLVTSLDAAS